MANVQTLASRIASTLRDASFDNWTQASLHDAIYEGEFAVINYEPDATATLATVDCDEGVEQSIPADGSAFLTAYNVVTAAGGAGRGLRRKSMEDLDAFTPDWRSAAATASVREFCVDDRMPTTFFVSPPAVDTIGIRISYCKTPEAYGTVDANTVTTVRDSFAPAVVEWALYRLFGHDVEGSVNQGRSQKHLGTFFNLMGVKAQVERAQSPKNPEHKR